MKKTTKKEKDKFIEECAELVDEVFESNVGTGEQWMKMK